MRKNIFTSEQSLIRDIALLLAFFTVVFTVLCSAFELGNGMGTSMLPTLSTNNYSINYKTRKADRGDIVSLITPKEGDATSEITGYALDRHLEVRTTTDLLDGESQLVGEQGDIFEIKNYRYFVNGDPVNTKYTANIKNLKTTIGLNERCYISPYGSDIYTPYYGGIHAFKRVVAVPGDHIVIHDSTLYINGKSVNEPYLSEENHVFPGEVDLILGEDEYFVMGDNCNSSEDSRSVNLGNIKKEYIVGKVWFHMAGGDDGIGRVK